MVWGVAVVVSLVALWVAALRAITVADLRCDRGKLHVVRGGLAPRLLADLEDVVARPPLDGVRIRITRSRGRAEIALAGSIPEHQAQRIRNVIGSVPLAKLANGRAR
jgi:hypothetical protein